MYLYPLCYSFRMRYALRYDANASHTERGAVNHLQPPVVTARIAIAFPVAARRTPSATR